MNSIETKCSHFVGMNCKKFLETFKIRTMSWQVRLRNLKTSPKFRKHYSERITRWILMKWSVLALLICTATNYEQLSQTKLRLDIWNQVFTKTLTKLQKTLIGVKYLKNSNETNLSVFSSWNITVIKSEQHTYLQIE